jgi:hypothetical protein
MTKNQKIALGCGGGGCLGLIVLVVIAAALYFLYMDRLSANPTNRNSSVNFNSNRGAITNSDEDSNSTNSSNSSSSPDSSNSSNSSQPSTSMSDDDKHKLFQAASMTADAELVRRVGVKIGLMSENNTPGGDYAGFIRDHLAWAARNADFLRTINTPEKARAYVDAHIDD